MILVKIYAGWEIITLFSKGSVDKYLSTAKENSIY